MTEVNTKQNGITKTSKSETKNEAKGKKIVKAFGYRIKS